MSNVFAFNIESFFKWQTESIENFEKFHFSINFLIDSVRNLNNYPIEHPNSIHAW